MSKTPNQMSTQDDPENFPWQSGEMPANGMVYFGRMNSPFLIRQNIVHSSWLSAATDAAEGAQATLAARRAQIGGRFARTTFITPAGFIPQTTDLNASNFIGTNGSGILEGNHVASPIPAIPEGSTPHADPCKTIQTKADWVEQLSWAIPKQDREQIFGDLCEKRATMAAEGYSSPQIMWTTLSQLLWSISWWLWSRLGWIVLLYNRISEWLNPNK
jgi:hypothetical protein